MLGSLFSTLLGGLFNTTSSVVKTATLGIVDIEPIVPTIPLPTVPVHPGPPNDAPVGDEHEVIGPDAPASEVAQARMTVLKSDMSDYDADIDAADSAPGLFFLFRPDPAQSRDVNKGSIFGDHYNGSGSAEKYFGMGGNDHIFGGGGADRLNGGDGNDTVSGGSGQDILEGGRGVDTLIGGGDIDVFVLRKGCDVTTIADFALGYDVLDLEGYNVPIAQSYDRLVEGGIQMGQDVHFNIEGDVLILQNADLSSMVADDLCIR